MNGTVKILFVTDFVCPYCIVAKEALKQAARELGLKLEWKLWPMELTEEPKERVDTYHDPVRRERYKVLEKPLRQLRLDAKFPPAVVPRPYTRLAWEGWHFAKEKGLDGLYSDLVYRAYFIDEKDIGDLAVLSELAGRAGLDREEYQKALQDGTYRAAEKQATDYSRNTMQIKSVPTIFFNGQKVRVTEYTKEEMMRLLQQATEQADTADTDCAYGAAGAGGFGCGPDGCGF